MSPVYPDGINTGNRRTGKHLPTISESEVEVSAFPTGLAALSSETEEAVDGHPSSGDFRLAGKGDVPRLPDGSVTSIGSLKHPHCTPCIFMALKASGSKSSLCSAGAGCEYCRGRFVRPPLLTEKGCVGDAQDACRSFRNRLGLFSRQWKRRGTSVAVEGAFLVLSQLQDVAWDASESIHMDDIELLEDPFKPIVKVLDNHFQHEEEEEVELPERCQEFFEQFQRERREELQAYLVRQQTMLKKLKDLQVGVKAMCNGNLTVANVARSFTRMFGGDSKPNAKDTTFRNDVHLVEYDPGMEDDEVYDTYYYDDDETYDAYYNQDEDDYQDDVHYAGETVAEDEIPQELDEALLMVEDAYINYLDSRGKIVTWVLPRCGH
eukprot:s1946_g13.t2